MNKIACFILSTYSFVFKSSIDKILEAGYQSKNGNPIPSFDENILTTLCTDAKEIFEKENNVLQIEGDVIIVGDIHGSFHDLIRILNYFQTHQKKVIFLGDYVDRGNFSLECITILFALKVIRPDLFFLIRGNHEFDYICSKYGFKEEILNYYNPKKPITEKHDSNQSILTMDLENSLYHEYLADHKFSNCYSYSESLYDAFVDVFSYLQICAIVNDTTFCIHGGLGPNLEYVDDINKHITRPVKQFDQSPLLSDVVWGDPSGCSHSIFRENLRGSGYLFNVQAVNFFLNKNSLKRIVRGHECVSNGVKCLFENKCITVFSASCYDSQKGNRSGFLELFQKDDKIEVKSFPCIDRLQKSDTVYYKVQNHDQNQTHRIPFSLAYPYLNSPIKSTKNMNFIHINTKFHTTLNVSKQSTIFKPSFTTKNRKSLTGKLHQSSSIANLDSVSSITVNDKSAEKISLSRSISNIF